MCGNEGAEMPRRILAPSPQKERGLMGINMNSPCGRGSRPGPALKEFKIWSEKREMALEQFLEQVETGVCAKGPKSSERQVSTVWRSLRKSRMDLEDGLECNQVEEKEKLSHSGAFSANKDWGRGMVARDRG